MRAAVGRRSWIALHCAASVGWVAWMPCAAQDVPLRSVNLGETTAEQQAQQGPAPRLSLTLSYPWMATGVGSGAGLAGAAAPAPLDLGLRWRQPVSNGQHLDITAWRRLSPEPDALTLIRQREPVYGARFEMKLAFPRKRGFVTDLRFIGLQLDNGARITIRRKDGNPMLYYRARF